MFGLAVATEPDWLDRVLPRLDDVLLEQAHLERKAAAMAINYLFRYQQHAFLQVPLSELAREELSHFEIIVALLERRGVAFGPQESSGYAARLLEVVRPTEPDRMLDSFLCSAVIEARSCERMKLLGEALTDSDPELAAIYAELVASEARHHGLYQRLAKRVFEPSVVDDRFAEIAAHEAGVQRDQPRRARLHT